MSTDAHKKGVRILAVASGPVEGRSKTIAVGVVQREMTTEGILSTSVEVDGTDSTAKILKMLVESKFRQQVKILAFDGVALAGLNLVDAARIAKESGATVLLLTRKRPRRNALEKALREYSKAKGTNISGRLSILNYVDGLTSYKSSGFYVKSTAKMKESDETVASAFEALRLAHMIARGISSGESRGRV